MEWKQLTPEEAAQQKYYGMGGWLLFFYVLAVIAFVGSFANLMNHEAMKLVYGDSYVVMLAFGVLGALLILPFIIMAPQKNPLMPRGTIWAYSLQLVLLAISAFVAGPAIVLPQLIAGVIYVLLFCWFLKRSKRVNVTYLHRVRAEAADAPAEA